MSRNRLRRDFHVVLDLDSTCVLTLGRTEEGAQRPAHSPRRRVAGGSGRGNFARQEMFVDVDHPCPMRVHFRPWLAHFLQELFENMATVSIWSAGETEYVGVVAQHLERISGGRFYTVWSRERCETDGKGNYIKPMTKFITSPEGKAAGMRDDNVFLIDDLVDNEQLNPNNALRPLAYDDVEPYDFALPETLFWIMKTAESCPLLPSRAVLN